MKKARTEDKKKRQLEMIDKDLDERDIWMGIRTMANEYKPRPYSRKRKNGEPVPLEQIAEEAAKYLHEEHWGKNILETNGEKYLTQK